LKNTFNRITSYSLSTNIELDQEALWIFIQTVIRKNRVRLCITHITTDTDALDYLLKVWKFMARVLQDKFLANQLPTVPIATHQFCRIKLLPATLIVVLIRISAYLHLLRL
jgi:hypothetical protein